MGSHPANLALRFGLELAALASLGWWGYRFDHPIWRWVLALALPIAAAALWGVFAVPDDPSRSGNTVVATPGWARLILELAFFAAAVFVLHHRNAPWLSLVLGTLVVLHYAASYDRIAWLLRH
jgi:hypothetical protein